MQLKAKSNGFLALLAAPFLLTACMMQDHAGKSYTSSEEGYEVAVAQEVNKRSARSGRGSGANSLANVTVPVIVNNPYALGQSLGMTNAPAPNTYSSYGNPYGGLNSAVIQQGVFAPGAIPAAQYPTYGGTNIYSPATR